LYISSPIKREQQDVRESGENPLLPRNCKRPFTKPGNCHCPIRREGAAAEVASQETGPSCRRSSPLPRGRRVYMWFFAFGTRLRACLDLFPSAQPFAPKKFWAWAPVVLLFSALQLAGQTPSIRGTIKDSQGAVIPNAQVELLRDGQKVSSVVTNGMGEYRFFPVAVGIYQIQAVARGFSVQKSSPFGVGADSFATFDFMLRVGVPTEEIVVTATGIPMPESQVGASVSVIPRQVFEDRVDILQPMQQVPGVQVVQSGQRGAETSLFIRGGSSNGNEVLLDDDPVDHIGGVVNFGNTANTGIDQLKVLRGPNSVLYGPDAMAGVVSLTTRRGVTPKPELSYSFDAGNFNTFRHDGTF